MIIIVGLVAFTVAGMRLQYHSQPFEWADTLGFFMTVIGGLLLAAALLLVALNRAGTHSEIAQYEAIRTTIEVARAEGVDPLERAATQVRVIEANAWLAGKQYWNGTILDIWIPDEVDTIEPIR